MYDREALAKLIQNTALEFGDFTLASGKKASYYLDCRKVTLDARGAKLIGEGMIDLIGEMRLKMGQGPKLVGGMAIGADPITAAILTTAGIKGYSLRGVMVRKEPKEHGKGKQVEGPYNDGESIVIVEDVVTTGTSSLKAIKLCEAEGLKIERVLAIVDRMEGGREAFKDAGYELTSLFTVEDLGVRTG